MELVFNPRRFMFGLRRYADQWEIDFGPFTLVGFTKHVRDIPRGRRVACVGWVYGEFRAEWKMR